MYLNNILRARFICLQFFQQAFCQRTLRKGFYVLAQHSEFYSELPATIAGDENVACAILVPNCTLHACKFYQPVDQTDDTFKTLTPKTSKWIPTPDKFVAPDYYITKCC